MRTQNDTARTDTDELEQGYRNQENGDTVRWIEEARKEPSVETWEEGAFSYIAARADNEDAQRIEEVIRNYIKYHCSTYSETPKGEEEQAELIQDLLVCWALSIYTIPEPIEDPALYTARMCCAWARVARWNIRYELRREDENTETLSDWTRADDSPYSGCSESARSLNPSRIVAAVEEWHEGNQTFAPVQGHTKMRTPGTVADRNRPAKPPRKQKELITPHYLMTGAEKEKTFSKLPASDRELFDLTKTREAPSVRFYEDGTYHREPARVIDHGKEYAIRNPRTGTTANRDILKRRLPLTRNQETPNSKTGTKEKNAPAIYPENGDSVANMYTYDKDSQTWHKTPAHEYEKKGKPTRAQLLNALEGTDTEQRLGQPIGKKGRNFLEYARSELASSQEN
jgi:hypothetical protein